MKNNGTETDLFSMEASALVQSSVSLKKNIETAVIIFFKFTKIRLDSSLLVIIILYYIILQMRTSHLNFQI